MDALVTDAVTAPGDGTDGPGPGIEPTGSAGRPGVPVIAAVLLALASVVLGIGLRGWWDDRAPGEGTVAVGFYDDMTTHHFQAIAMARAYMERGDDSVLHSTAAEISLGQAGDIRVMQDALSDWGAVGTPDTAMEWMGMPVPQNAQPGMATPDEMAALRQATGRELDDLFTRLMIDHHHAGAEMATAAADDTTVGSVEELARAMARTQSREIDELNHRRLDIGLPLYEPAADAGHEGHDATTRG